MVMNFLAGGAAINVFAKQHGIRLKVVDAGVNYDFTSVYDLIDAKIGKGTKSFLDQKAMSAEECQTAIRKGAVLVKKIHQAGCNVIGFGEMGIGNTSSAAMLMHGFAGLPLETCVGRGTGVDDKGLKRKLSILKEAKDYHGKLKDPIELLQTYGGFEMAMMFGAMCEAASLKMLVLVDGFIATSSLLVANALYPEIMEYVVCCHQSDEQGHARMLEFLKTRPLLKMNMRLGEGTGCALAYPLLESAINFLNEMASFESAGVSQKSE